MHKPLVSVVIPCYNHGAYVHEAIQSVEALLDRNSYEIIVVNDGSTDVQTIQVMQKLLQDGYHIINQTNQGLAATRNNGIRQARGKYILPLDADNKIKPEYVLQAIPVLEECPEVAVVYSDMEYFGDKTGIRRVGEVNCYQMYTMNRIDACAVFRKSVWEECGGYDEQMPIMGWEDWDFWLSVLQRGYHFQYIPQPLYYYRVSGTSMISRTNQPDSQLALRKYVLEKHLLGQLSSKWTLEDKRTLLRYIVHDTTYNLLRVNCSYETLTKATRWFKTFQLDLYSTYSAVLGGITKLLELKSKEFLLPWLKKYRLYRG